MSNELANVIICLTELDGGLKVLSQIEKVITEDSLGKYWDKVLKTYGPTRTIGVYMDALVTGLPSLAAFLPLYLVASFLKCQQCARCCKPNERKWDKGVILTKEEMLSLSHYCQISKRKGEYLLEYPCPLLEDDHCRQYQLRPFGCRVFPFNISREKGTNRFRQGIIMACPAGKELYVTSQLFLKELALYLEERRQMGIQRFGIPELETVRLRFDHNQVSKEDMAHMKKVAMSYSSNGVF